MRDVRDADARRVSERIEEHYRALFDELTGCPGPVLLRDRIEMAFAQSERARRHVAVFSVPLELPRDAGVGEISAAIAAFAAALRAAVRPEDTVARPTETEFVVVCPSVSYEEDAAKIAERLWASVWATLFPFDRPGSGVVARIGLAVSRDRRDAGQLADDARAASSGTPSE